MRIATVCYVACWPQWRPDFLPSVPIVVTALAKREMAKYNLVGWLPTFVTDAGSNVRRALAGRITQGTFREGGNLADWSRCVCHMLHNVVQYALQQVKDHAASRPGTKTLHEALTR